jgi:ribose 5-phosphate isomerase B
MRIALASDHAGYALKRFVSLHLSSQGHECVDFGADTDAQASSYVPFAVRVSEAVARGECDRGVLVCGTGIGISITANKTRGIRAALCTDEYMARMSRRHNDANVLALGARVVGTGLAAGIVDAFLSEPFEAGGRHQERVDEIRGIEAGNFR